MKHRFRSLGALVLAVSTALGAATFVTATASSAGVAASVAKNDPGIGSAEALADPMCDQATKRVRLQSYSAPLCVKPWKDGADNGGATAQGVTADTIKVVVLYGDLPEAQLATKGLYVNQATGENSPTAPVDSTKDINEIYKYAYETWGRTVEFEFVKTTGEGEAAQRADAVTVAAMKPFAVLDEATSIGTPPVGGGAVFAQALKNAGVPLVISTGSAAPQELSRSYSLPTAEFIGKQLKGGKAEYADESMQSQPRKFGVLYPSHFDIKYFEAQLARYGVKLASRATYTVPAGAVSLQTSSPEIDQQVVPLVTKLKADGVNNLIMMSTHAVVTAATNAMKAQEWYPEITATSFPYTDLDLLARSVRPGRVVARIRPRVVPAWCVRRRPDAEHRDVPVVLGHRPGHAVGRRQRVARSALHRHPVRGSQARQESNRRGTGPLAEGELRRRRRLQQQRLHLRVAATGAGRRSDHPRCRAGLVERG